MWEPSGPLPASVYWRRRWVTAAAVLGAVVGVAVAAAGEPTPDPAPEPEEPGRLVSAPGPAQPPECANQMISVGAEIDRPEYRVGQQATLRLVVTNVSAQPCVRDLDPARQEVLVVSEDLQSRLWSSNDCGNPSSGDRRTLQPNQPLGFRVPWNGRTTSPGCAEKRAPVPAGTYKLVTRLDDVYSEPVTFRRLP